MQKTTSGTIVQGHRHHPAKKSFSTGVENQVVDQRWKHEILEVEARRPEKKEKVVVVRGFLLLTTEAPSPGAA